MYPNATDPHFRLSRFVCAVGRLLFYSFMAQFQEVAERGDYCREVERGVAESDERAM